MTFKEKIKALLANKETKPLPHQSLDMGQIEEKLSEKILQETGLDLIGFTIY